MLTSDNTSNTPESVYYDLEIRELAGPDSSHLEQATQASKQSLAD